jgi:hypothetical protein
MTSLREEREKREHALGEKRTINKIGLIISNILEKLSGLIIPNRGSIPERFVSAPKLLFTF